MQAKIIQKSEKIRFYRSVLIGLLLVLMTLALYWPVQSFDFVNYDDEVYITNNRQVRGGFSPEGIAWSFRTSMPASGSRLSGCRTCWTANFTECMPAGITGRAC